jgi:hypothetical protein
LARKSSFKDALVVYGQGLGRRIAEAVLMSAESLCRHG